MLYRRKRDFEAASAFFFEPTHGLIEPHLKGNNPSEWQDTYGKTKRVPAFVARAGATESTSPMIAASSAALCILKAVALVCIRDANRQAHCVSKFTTDSA